MTERLTAGERLAAPASDPKPPKPPKPPGRRRGRATPPFRRGLFRPLHALTRLIGALAGLAVLGAGIVGVGGYFAYQRFSADLPDVEGLQHYQPRVMSRVYAADSRLLSELATERRIFVPYAAIPDIVKRAFLSAEDQNFFIHRGVDPLAIARAGVTDLLNYGQGRRPVGASTITQQVAKNILLGSSSEVSLARKAREAILAIRLEETLSKERILELYLNEIYLGMQAYGVAAAAQSYFNKSLDELTVGDAAFLAALPKAPNNYNPFRSPDAAKARRDWVLDRMAEDHAIPAEQAAAAKAAADRAGAVPPPRHGDRGGVFRRGSAALDGRPVRRGNHHAGRAGGAQHARSGVAGRRRPRLARRADAVPTAAMAAGAGR